MSGTGATGIDARAGALVPDGAGAARAAVWMGADGALREDRTRRRTGGCAASDCRPLVQSRDHKTGALESIRRSTLLCGVVSCANGAGIRGAKGRMELAVGLSVRGNSWVRRGLQRTRVSTVEPSGRLDWIHPNNGASMPNSPGSSAAATRYPVLMNRLNLHPTVRDLQCLNDDSRVAGLERWSRPLDRKRIEKRPTHDHVTDLVQQFDGDRFS